MDKGYNPDFGVHFAVRWFVHRRSIGRVALVGEYLEGQTIEVTRKKSRSLVLHHHGEPTKAPESEPKPDAQGC